MARQDGSGIIQRSVSSGHNFFYLFVYQTLSTPDDRIFALYVPEEDLCNCLTLFRQRNRDQILQANVLIDGRKFYVYGDSAYLLGPQMQRPFINGLSSLYQKVCHKRMTSVLMTVEHQYKYLKHYWSSQDFVHNIKLLNCSISLLYKSSILLINMCTCPQHSGKTIQQHIISHRLRQKRKLQ